MFDCVWKVTHLSLFPVPLSLEASPCDGKCYICRYHFFRLSKYVVSEACKDGQSDLKTAKWSTHQDLSHGSTWFCFTAALWLNSWTFASWNLHVHLDQLPNQLFQLISYRSKQDSLSWGKNQEMSVASRGLVFGIIFACHTVWRGRPFYFLKRIHDKLWWEIKYDDGRLCNKYYSIIQAAPCISIHATTQPIYAAKIITKNSGPKKYYRKTKIKKWWI